MFRKGGDWSCDQGPYTSIVINNDERQMYLDNGWYATLDEAFASNEDHNTKLPNIDGLIDDLKEIDGKDRKSYLASKGINLKINGCFGIAKIRSMLEDHFDENVARDN